MLNSLIKKIFSPNGVRKLCTPAAVQSFGEIIPLNTAFQPKYQAPRQVWIENFDTVEEQKLGLIELHPEIFAAQPRIDVIHQNVEWQRKYRFVSFAHSQLRSERPGGGRKPWPQKGLGRARHGSIRSPLFKGGGIVHGPRSPTTHFYMLSFYHRVHGLISTLSVKLAQDDMHIINNLDIPTDDPQYIKDLIDTRLWGPSVLIVDDIDIAPRNTAIAIDGINHVHIQPVFGLNCYSMLKYDTLVLTLGAVEQIQSKLLHHLHRSDASHLGRKFKLNQ